MNFIDESMLTNRRWTTKIPRDQFNAESTLSVCWVCVHSSTIMQLFCCKKDSPHHCSGFSQKFPYCGLVYFSQQEKTLTSNKFINQTNDIFPLPGHNCNHQQRFLKQNNVVLHRCGFDLKLLKHCYFDRYFG